ncbi:hypothetical protein GCM10027294_43600 [Marinactinospora endophytica]
MSHQIRPIQDDTVPTEPRRDIRRRDRDLRRRAVAHLRELDGTIKSPILDAAGGDR